LVLFTEEVKLIITTTILKKNFLRNKIKKTDLNKQLLWLFLLANLDKIKRKTNQMANIKTQFGERRLVGATKRKKLAKK